MKKFGQQIVVIDNGFVHVGECSVTDGFMKISSARNIRVWGTTKGLGELVNGPLKTTTHDSLGDVIIPMSRVVWMMEAKGWS